MRNALAFLAAVTQVSLATPARAEIKSCSTGTVIFGDPKYQGSDPPNPEGQSVRDDPPLAWRSLVFANGKIFTTTGEELWVVDGGKAKRFAGFGSERFVAGESSVGEKIRAGGELRAKFGDNDAGLAFFVKFGQRRNDARRG